MLRTENILRLVGLLVLVVGPVILSWQGWREQQRNPTFAADLVTSSEAAWKFLHDGTVPRVGAISSTLGSIPPGTAWLLLPGVALSRDRRLYELPATALLHLCTVIGIIVLGKLLLSEMGGWIAASLYAYSWTAMFFAAFLWPRGLPAVTVWVVVCCVVAMQKSRPSMLALAAVIYAAGLYVLPEILPLGIAFPLTVAFDRRTFAWKWIVPAAASSVIIWAPYLYTEIGEHFTDVRNLVGLSDKRLTMPQASPAWCESPGVVYDQATGKAVDIAPTDLHYPPRPQLTSMGAKLRYLLGTFVRSWVYNIRASERRNADATYQSNLSARVTNVFFFALLLVGCFRIRRSPSGMLVLVVFFVGQFFWGFLAGAEDRRFYWIWPLECVVIGSAILWFCGNTRIPTAGAAVVLVFLSGWHGGKAPAAIEAWKSDSWSGHDDEITRQLDKIGRELPPESRQVSISYDRNVLPYIFWFNPVDRRYTVSMVYDQYLLHRYGVRNTVFCVDSYKRNADFEVNELHRLDCSPRQRFRWTCFYVWR